jgi:hypothetical protein
MLSQSPVANHSTAIYSNSNSDSRLRHFALAGVYTWFRNVEDVKNKDFKTLLSNNSEVLDDFLDLIRSESINQDPRIRQCQYVLSFLTVRARAANFSVANLTIVAGMGAPSAPSMAMSVSKVTKVFSHASSIYTKALSHASRKAQMGILVPTLRT